MANNRIYLRCKTCGEVLRLGKCYASEYFYNDYGDSPLENKLNEFYKKHWLCCDELTKDYYEPKVEGQYDGNWQNRFDLAYENYHPTDNTI